MIAHSAPKVKNISLTFFDMFLTCSKHQLALSAMRITKKLPFVKETESGSCGQFGITRKLVRYQAVAQGGKRYKNDYKSKKPPSVNAGACASGSAHNSASLGSGFSFFVWLCHGAKVIIFLYIGCFFFQTA